MFSLFKNLPCVNFWWKSVQRRGFQNCSLWKSNVSIFVNFVSACHVFKHEVPKTEFQHRNFNIKVPTMHQNPGQGQNRWCDVDCYFHISLAKKNITIFPFWFCYMMIVILVKGYFLLRRLIVFLVEICLMKVVCLSMSKERNSNQEIWVQRGTGKSFTKLCFFVFFFVWIGSE